MHNLLNKKNYKYVENENQICEKEANSQNKKKLLRKVSYLKKNS